MSIEITGGTSNATLKYLMLAITKTYTYKFLYSDRAYFRNEYLTILWSI